MIETDRDLSEGFQQLCFARALPHLLLRQRVQTPALKNSRQQEPSRLGCTAAAVVRTLLATPATPATLVGRHGICGTQTDSQAVSPCHPQLLQSDQLCCVRSPHAGCSADSSDHLGIRWALPGCSSTCHGRNDLDMPRFQLHGRVLMLSDARQTVHLPHFSKLPKQHASLTSSGAVEW